jgi:hypothetical protein
VGELKMQYLEVLEDSQEETEKEDHNQLSELDDMEVEIKSLIVVHGEQEIKSM